MLIQLFDDSDINYVGGVYQVARNDGSDFSQADFLEAWQNAFKEVKKEYPHDWDVDDVFKKLNTAGWNFESMDVTNVVY